MTVLTDADLHVMDLEARARRGGMDLAEYLRGLVELWRGYIEAAERRLEALEELEQAAPSGQAICVCGSPVVGGRCTYPAPSVLAQRTLAAPSGEETP